MESSDSNGRFGSGRLRSRTTSRLPARLRRTLEWLHSECLFFFCPSLSLSLSLWVSSLMPFLSPLPPSPLSLSYPLSLSISPPPPSLSLHPPLCGSRRLAGTSRRGSAAAVPPRACPAAAKRKVWYIYTLLWSYYMCIYIYIYIYIHVHMHQ